MITIVLQSSLEKIFLSAKEFDPPYLRGSGLLGERVSYQAAVKIDGEGLKPGKIRVESPLQAHVTVYQVGNVPCELPAYPDHHDDDYLTTEPGLFPDVLLPLAETVELSPHCIRTFWVDVDIPEDCPAGEYPITLVADCGGEQAESVFTLRVIGAELPKQKLIYTQWFHVDCLADYYNVPIYSPEHWALLERYIREAAAHGMNMLLTPVFTPALDTEIGSERPCTQLLDLTKEGESYAFGYERLTRFIELAQSCGITHFEISHLFTQWGAGFAPNIYALENGERKRIFGWDTKADSPEYRGFLAQLLPSLTAYLEKMGLKDKVMFHISDEPGREHLDSYRRAKEGVAPYLKGWPIRDALSEYSYYRDGIIDGPIAATNFAGPFLENRVPGLWVYTCCGQNVDVGNRFLAMPSYRNRILGQQLWKYGISGFLHWGFNFWYSQNSRGKIDPYRVTDAGGAFPGGDPFSVYPGPEGPVPSLRLKVFHEALQDLRAFSLLEELAGRKAVEELLEDYEGLTFAHYPRSAQSLLSSRERVNKEINDILQSKG